jgi:hypothetical protein
VLSFTEGGNEHKQRHNSQHKNGEKEDEGFRKLIILYLRINLEDINWKI